MGGKRIGDRINGGKPSNPGPLARADDAARQAGRIPTCTPEVTQRIVVQIAAGASFTAACAHAGVGRSTGKEWRAKGRQGIEPYAEFERAMELAEDAWQASAETMVYRARDWKAQAWMLERRRPEYRPPSKVEHSGPGGGPIVVAGKRLEEMSAAELEAEKARLLAEAVGRTGADAPERESTEDVGE